VYKLFRYGKDLIKDGLGLFDWKTDRQFIIIESDDWGSIRMPSIEVFNNLTRAGVCLDNDDGAIYNKYDTLATYKDLECLLEVLSGFRDSTGRSPVFTPVSLVANPDFDRIRDEGFQTYYYETLPGTLKRYPGCENVLSLWKEGIDKRLFVPQFHGREHLNVIGWMRALNNGHKNVSLAFKNGFWGISTSQDPGIGLELQAAFDFIEPDDLNYHKEVLKSGISEFEKIFGYRPVLFVPPNGPLSSQLETVCFSEGLKYISYPRIQTEPMGRGKTRIRLHYSGKRGRNGLGIFIRNCFFEPSQPGTDWVNSCLLDISKALSKGHPAIICTHRVNYIGALYPENRSNGLRKLNALLASIITKWPDIEFITTEELGRIVYND